MRIAFAMLSLALLAGCVRRARPADPVQWAEARRACQWGVPDACLWIGVTSEERGDFAAARRLYTPGCEAGFAEACSRLAGLAYSGRGQPADHALGAQLAQKACEGGSAAGCQLLGVALFHGRGIPKDVAKSTACFALACAREDSGSCRDYANALNDGRGVPVDIPHARALWRKTCPQEDVSCSLLSTSLKAENSLAAVEIAQEGCSAGGAASCHWLGDWYYDQKSLDLAARYFRTGCAWGDSSSCSYLVAVLQQMTPPLLSEAILMLSDRCQAGHTYSCHRVAHFKIIRDGRSDALVAEIEALCRGGESESCGWVCEDGKKDLSSASCKAACADGAKKYCAQ